MPTATFTQPDCTTQEAAAYKASIDAATRVMSGVAAQFAAHEAATPDMTVVVDAGSLMVAGTLVAQAAQTTAAFVAPVTHPRIDRIVIDQLTGVAEIVAGTEAAEPVAPDVPAGKLPIAQVALATDTTAITNSLITDERALIVAPSSGGGAQLSGPTSIYISGSGEYTITNFDVFSAYSATVSAGSVSIAHDKIIVTAPATAQTVDLTVTVNGTDGDPVALAIIDSAIIGIALIEPGNNGGTWAWIDADGNATSAPSSAYLAAHPVWGGIADQTVDSQVMVKIPKFFIKSAVLSSGPYNGKRAWWISDTATAGYVIHPAFRNAGVDVDQFWVGKYQGYLSGGKLGSVSGVAPTVSRTLTQFQADCAARNVSGVTGFMLWSVFQWSAIQWLYLLENGTMDSQTKTGRGRVDTSSAANVNASDVAQATYRGIVGLWGNVSQWVDGLKTVLSNSGAISLWDRNGNKTWVNTGKIPGANAAWAYPLTFAANAGSGYDMTDVFLYDTSLNVNSGATATDGQYFKVDADYFPGVGGSWSDASGAGLWYVSCNAAASGSGTSGGARLAKV